MGRRRESEERMSLFPFLSIVICVIGFLTILIASEAISKIGEKPNPEALERTAAYRQQLAKLKEIEEELKGRRDVEYATAFDATIKRAEEDLDTLKEEKAERDKILTDQESATADLRAEIERLKKHIESVLKEIEERKKIEADLEQEVCERKSPAGSGGRQAGRNGKECSPFLRRVHRYIYRDSWDRGFKAYSDCGRGKQSRLHLFNGQGFRDGERHHDISPA